MDSRYADSLHASFILPMRDQTTENLALYCTARGLSSTDALQTAPPAPVSTTASHSDINGLCRHFVLSLAQNHAATISTILKTATKLQVRRLFNNPFPPPSFLHVQPCLILLLCVPPPPPSLKQAFDFNNPACAPESSVVIPGIPPSLLAQRKSPSAAATGSKPPVGDYVLDDYCGYCTVCTCPIPDDEFNVEEDPENATWMCPSCRLQLLGEEDAMEPKSVVMDEIVDPLEKQLVAVFTALRTKK